MIDHIKRFSPSGVLRSSSHKTSCDVLSTTCSAMYQYMVYCVGKIKVLLLILADAAANIQ